MDGKTLHQKTNLKGRGNSKQKNLQRQEASGECEQIQGSTEQHGSKAEGCQRHVFTCVLLDNMLKKRW